VLTALATVARAEDPPPAKAKHENKVTPEARAAMEKYARLVYRPTDHGLVSLSGAIVQAGAGDAKPRPFSFEKAGHVDVAIAPGADSSSGRAKMGQVMLGAPLEATLAGISLTDGDEYDAEFVDRDGIRTLLVTRYRDGVERSPSSFTFDANGLVAATELGAGPGPPGRMRCTWEEAGERYRLAGLDIDAPLGGGAGSMHLRYRMTYATLGGVDLVTSYEFEASGTDGKQEMAKRCTFALVDVLVNGTKVDVPKPAVQERRISPEARAAIDRYLQRRYVPSEHGLRSLAGRIVPTGADPLPTTRFTWSPADQVVVTLADGVDPGSPEGQKALSTSRFCVSAALNGMEVAVGGAIDADFVERDGRRLLQISGYVKGTRTETREIELDGDGLLAAITVWQGPDAATAVTTTRFRLHWEKTGDRFRIARLELVRSGSDGVATRFEVAETYASVGGIDVPAGFTVTYTDDEGGESHAYAVRDLVVNGKKFAPPAPGGGATK
jgi:hypothetical protein